MIILSSKLYNHFPFMLEIGKYGSGIKILTTGCPCPAAKSVMGVYHKAGQPVIKIFMATVLKIVEQTADARKETEDFIIRNSMTFMITFFGFFQFVKGIDELINIIFGILHGTVKTFLSDCLLGKLLLFVLKTLFYEFIFLLHYTKLSVCIGENYFVSNRNLIYDRTERSSTIILIINRLFKSRKTNSSVFRFIHFKVGRKSYMRFHNSCN